MARPSSHYQELDGDMQTVTQGKGSKRKGGKFKRSDGSFSDSSNSFIRQQTHLKQFSTNSQRI